VFKLYTSSRKSFILSFISLYKKYGLVVKKNILVKSRVTKL